MASGFLGYSFGWFGCFQSLTKVRPQSGAQDLCWGSPMMNEDLGLSTWLSWAIFQLREFLSHPSEWARDAKTSQGPVEAKPVICWAPFISQSPRGKGPCFSMAPASRAAQGGRLLGGAWRRWVPGCVSSSATYTLGYPGQGTSFPYLSWSEDNRRAHLISYLQGAENMPGTKSALLLLYKNTN